MKHIRGRVIGAIATLVVGAMFAVPGTASAVSVGAERYDVLDVARITVSLAATDATGSAGVLVDGALVAARSASPGGSADFHVPLRAGIHIVRGMVRSRRGLVVSSPTRVRAWGYPLAPLLVSPGAYSGSQAPVTVKVGLGTTHISVWVNGRLAASRDVEEGSLASFGVVSLVKGKSTVVLVASNPVATTSRSASVQRLDFPWPTCIVIDKSERRLYWVRDGVLVKTYPIAIGKQGTQTPVAIWRIDAKYHTAPNGIYGPRKMRLFRKVGSGYAYTAYGIHGTNQPWVIGTMASRGCIRMYNHDVLELFPQVPLGTMVQTRE